MSAFPSFGIFILCHYISPRRICTERYEKTFFCKNIVSTRQNAEYFEKYLGTSPKTNFVKYEFCDVATHFSYLNFYSLALE
jgi:hypothetical protein